MQAYATETKDKFLGPVPVTEFVDNYIPYAGEIPWDERKSAFDKLLKADTVKSERELYPILLESLGAFCDGSMELVDTSNNIDTVNAGAEQDEVKPDITMYKVNSGRVKIADMSLAQTHFAVKFDPQDDPFADVRKEDDPFVLNTDHARATRGQITCCAIAQFSQQYRTHLFTVFIQKKWVRFIRWDRSGAIVTQKLNISTVEGAKVLAIFLWRLSRASDADRGLDETVTIPGEADAEYVARARKELGLSPTAPIWKFGVYDDTKEGEVNYCYGSHPRFRGRNALTGRCTRCIPVWDQVRKRCLLLKDAWRVVGEGMVKEGDIYGKLRAAEVHNIPECHQAGDIPLRNHHTKTCDIDLATLRQHQHYRLLLDDVGEDLTQFDNTRTMVRAMRDAMQAHHEAYEKAKILHRDISTGNILIGKDGHGYLIDWDLSKPVAELREGARHSIRMGTWQFIAARLLLQPRGDLGPVFPELEDDLESFFHVLSWIILRYTKNGLSSEGLANTMCWVYDYAAPNADAPGGVEGGGRKAFSQILCKFMKNSARLPATALRDLIYDLEIVFTVRYEDKPSPSQAFVDMRQREYDAASAEERQELDSIDVMGFIRKGKLNSVWMINRFTEAIDSDNWPEADCVRIENKIASLDSAYVWR